MLYNPNMKRIGFTLAEVLITIGIIGVVAAITIPTLMQNIQDYQFKQAWKKEYSVINQAYIQMKQDNGGDFSGYFNNSDDASVLLQSFSNYFRTISVCNYIANICGINPVTPLTNSYKTLSGSYIQYTNLNYVQYVLQDGSNFYSRSNHGSWADRTLIWIDVNGYLKGPNVLGRDLFGLIMTKDKILPMGATGTGVENSCVNTSFSCTWNYDFDGGDCAGAGCSKDALSQ